MQKQLRLFLARNLSELKERPQGDEDEDLEVLVMHPKELDTYIASGDERFGYPDKKNMLSYEFNDVSTWLSDVLKSDPIEVSIVGDLNLAETIEGVSVTDAHDADDRRGEDLLMA